MKILACNSNRPLAEAIAAYLDKPLTKAEIRRFADMEVFAEIQENVRGRMFSSFNPPPILPMTT